MRYPAPEGLIGSLYEFHGHWPIMAMSTWVVVGAWKGDGRGKRGRKGMWRVTLAPINGSDNLPMFQALWNDVGKHLESWDSNGNWMLTRQIK